jgi:hypothetical protein
MKGFAADAHVPVVDGEVYDRSLVEKDRNYRGTPGGASAAGPKKKKAG